MKYFFYILFLFLAIKLSAQEQDVINLDTTDNQSVEKKIDYLPLTKSPSKAVFRSLVFPGWGQIYVENYWKSPVFIGAAGFLWYRIISNHIDYVDYKKQLNKIEDQASFEYRVVQGQMITAVDNRDISGLYLLGVYILSMVDAYSGAHLFDFKVNSNVSYFIKPDIYLIGVPNIKVGLCYSF